jgi:hypothetical protein
MAKLHYMNKLANLLCDITNELICWAVARPAPNKLYNLLGAGLARAQQLGSIEFIS